MTTTAKMTTMVLIGMLFLMFSSSNLGTVTGASWGRWVVPAQQRQQQQQDKPFSRIGFVNVIPSSLTLTTRQRGIDLRGGGVVLDDDDDDDEEDFDEDEDDDDLLELEEDEEIVVETDFDEDKTMDMIVSAWKKTPPLTRLFLQASIITSIYGFVLNKNEFPKLLTLEWKPVLYKLQIWRPFTCFLNFGPFGLSYLLTAHFVWTYMATLERLSHNKPFDFWIMILFGKLSMVIGYPLLKLSPKFLGHNLSTYLVYIWSRYHEGVEVNIFEMFNTRAELLPWIFLAQTFLLEGEPPILDFLGIVFGHIYHHCKTVGLLTAPDFLVDWYNNGTSPLAVRIREQYREISSDFEMQ